MRSFSGWRGGVDQGDVEVFSDFENGGDMWTGTGRRERRAAVVFSGPFREVPVVHAGMSLWDFANDANMRAEVTAENVTTAGFDLVFRTWSDSRVARARLSWLAIGALAGDDDWDV